MESRPRLPLSEYWYPGALDRTIDATLRAACTLAWPYALYCAKRFHRDIHVARIGAVDSLASVVRMPGLPE